MFLAKILIYINIILAVTITNASSKSLEIDNVEYHTEAVNSLDSNICLFRNTRKIKCFLADNVDLGQSLELNNYLLTPIRFSSGGVNFQHGWSSLIIDSKKDFRMEEFDDYITSSIIIDADANQAKFVLSNYNSGEYLPKKILIFNNGKFVSMKITKSLAVDFEQYNDCDRLNDLRYNCTSANIDICGIEETRSILSSSDREFLKYLGLLMSRKDNEDLLMSCNKNCPGDFSKIVSNFEKKFCQR